MLRPWGFRLKRKRSEIFLNSQRENLPQGCDSRTRGNHARGLKNSLHAVFTRYLRGYHVRYIYGNILKNTVNTGDSVFFLVVGGRRVFKFRAFVCGALAFLFILSFSLRAPFPPALCVRLQLQCSSPWTMVVRISLCHSSFFAT